MNTNQDSIRILCYGDSNTWGDSADDSFRYPANVRWTGLLQQKLGDRFEIIEEGLCGRTTTLDDPKEEGRNGKTYLIPCVITHNPLDLVILMLGTNDLKERFNLSTEQISKNIEELIIVIKELGADKNNNCSKIILVSPVLVNENAKLPAEGMAGAEEKSKQFAKFYQNVAARQGCEFINMAQYVQPSTIDGCHLGEEGHAKISEVLEEKIREIGLGRS
jgi:lysophospholipase L1-like esterase